MIEILQKQLERGWVVDYIVERKNQIMLAPHQNDTRGISSPETTRKRKPLPARENGQCGFSISLAEVERKINSTSALLIFDLLKDELRRRAENGGDLAPFKKLPKALKEKLIVAIEDEEDIADTQKVISDIKAGKAKLIPWEKIKAKYGF